MAVWLVRAGRYGENEQSAIDNNLVTIGWNVLPDLSPFQTREAMTELFRQIHPEDSKPKVSNEVGQIWAFRDRIQKGDLVVLPLKTRSAIAIGRIAGDYNYRTDLGDAVHHTRPVDWLKVDLPRTTFDQDILFSFGAFMTVCQISRNNAEERIKAIISGKSTVGRKIESGSAAGATDESDIEVEESERASLDIEQAAKDQILSHIQSKFAGHDLARLVDAVLQAEGYLTRVSPPGPDGGVDILAGTGPMGFGQPRLCVQVKSSSSPSDVNVLRGLQGILQNFHAEQGLLISWGGFKSSVIQEARQSFFTIRLWDSGELLAAILKNHDKFPDELQAELPLKRIWALVLEN